MGFPDAPSGTVAASGHAANQLELVGRQRHVRRGGVAARLIGRLHSRNHRRHRRVRQQIGQRDLRQAAPRVRQRPHLPGGVQLRQELGSRALVPGGAIHVVEHGVPVELAGEDPPLQRHAHQRPDIPVGAERQQLALRRTIQRAVPKLAHTVAAALVKGAQDRRIVCRNAVGPDLARLEQLLEGLHQHFGMRRIGLVALVNVDDVRAQPVEAGVAAVVDVLDRLIAEQMSRVPADLAHLGRDQHLVAHAAQRLAEHQLAQARSIGVGRVEERHTRVDGRVHRRVRLRLRHRSQPAAETPAAHAHDGHFESGLAQPSILHAVPLIQSPT